MAYRRVDILMREARAYSGLAIIALALSAIIWAFPEASFWLPHELGWTRMGLAAGAAAAAIATYIAVFSPLKGGRLSLAGDTSMVLGAPSLILGLIVGGLLLLIANSKLRAAAMLPGRLAQYPWGKAPRILEVNRYCPSCGAISDLEATHCHRCGAPLYGW